MNGCRLFGSHSFVPKLIEISGGLRCASHSLLRGNYQMEQSSDPNTVRSIFKDGKSETTTDAYTTTWIKLINLMEHNQN